MKLLLVLFIFYLRSCIGQTVHAPIPPRPSTDSEIVGFILQNPTGSTINSRFVTFAHAFGKGQLTIPSGSAVLTATSPSSASIGVQVDVKATFDDNSVKHAILTLRYPTLTGGQSIGYMLTTTTYPAGTDVSLSTFPANTVTVQLAISAPTSGTQNFDVSTLLSSALVANQASYWMQGPFATQARVLADVSSSMRMGFDVTLYSDGSYWVDVLYLNDIAMSPNGDLFTYNTVISRAGTPVYTFNSLDHYQYQTWHHDVYSAGAPEVNIQFDVLALIQAAAVHPYNLTMGVYQSVVTEYTNYLSDAGFGDPLSANGVLKAMPTTGGRQDIGPFPRPTASWLVSQDYNVFKYVMAWGDAAGAVPWNFFDKGHQRWLNTEDYPNIWYDTRCVSYSVCPTQQPSDNTGWQAEQSHMPSLSYVPYLVTGRRYYMDRMEATAAWSVGVYWDAARRNYGDVDLGLLFPSNQLRGGAWGMRELVLAHYITYDESPMKPYFGKIVKNNWSFLVNESTGWQQKQQQTYGYVMATDYGSGIYIMPPWQMDYFLSTVSISARQGDALAQSIMAWCKNWFVNRFLSADLNPANGYSYNLYIGTIDGNGNKVPYTTWARIQQELDTRNEGCVNNIGSCAGDYAQLAYESLVLYLVAYPNDPPTLNATNWMWNYGAPFLSLNDLLNDPSFSMDTYPPPRYAPGYCGGVVCGENAVCQTGQCVCADGYVVRDGMCVDADLSSGFQLSALVSLVLLGIAITY